MKHALTPFLFASALLASGSAPSAVRAGVVNPDISVVGQPHLRMTNDPADSDPKRVRLSPGETEIVFDAYLNPYAKGYVTTSLGESGLSLEEGFFTLMRGLPGGLSIKGGKYRVGFGKLNPAHPHTYPFAERFRVLKLYLPGEEALNEAGISVSKRIPAPGDMSLTASVDWLQGDTFRRERTATEDPGDPLNTPGGPGDRAIESRPAVAGRLSGFAMVGERSGLEFGISAVHGTNNVAAGARTTVLGADVKTKLWISSNSYLVLQTEGLKLRRQDASWNPAAGTYTRATIEPLGGYAFVDYNFKTRYNAGASYERYQGDASGKPWDQAVGLFAGLALMEETTAFRLDWNRFLPGRPAGAVASPGTTNTLTLRVIYSMGPHKAHQF